MAAVPDLRPVEGKYEILRKLNEGGMGAIYLVRHRLLEELRVVKVLHSQLAHDKDLRDRFVREARTAIHLRHPNVAQLYEFEVDGEGTAYMVLEFIDGRTVGELIAGGGVGSLRLKLEIAVQGLKALAFLHRKGFVHRDIAPDNVMLTHDADGAPLVKLLDLGIVKVLKGDEGLTGTAVFLGKVRYASPEQLESHAIDPRSDLYSFGVMFYELLTGIHPIPGNDLRALMSGHLFKPPLPFETTDPEGVIPVGLREIVLAVLEKDRARRPATAEEMRKRIEALPAWRETLDEGSLPPEVEGTPGSAAAGTITGTSAQRRLDEHFDAARRTPPPGSATLEAARLAAEEREAERVHHADPQRGELADGFRRRARALVGGKRFDEARWLIMGEARETLTAQEAEELRREIDWQEGSHRKLGFEVAWSCASSALSAGELDDARRALAEARELLPHEPRLRDLERRLASQAAPGPARPGAGEH